MALILDKSIFLHIPKTGGTWVRHALTALDIPFRETHRGDLEPGFGPVGSIHDVPVTDRAWGRPMWTMIRHPFSWYRSYFAYRMRYPWEDAILFDRRCKGDTFREFIDNVIREYPKGFVSQLYSTFLYVTFRYVNEAFKVGHIETLVGSFTSILAELGTAGWDPELLPGPVNETDSQRYSYEPNQLTALAECERWCFWTVWTGGAYNPGEDWERRPLCPPSVCLSATAPTAHVDQSRPLSTGVS